MFDLVLRTANMPTQVRAHSMRPEDGFRERGSMCAIVFSLPSILLTLSSAPAEDRVGQGQDRSSQVVAKATEVGLAT